ncbi:histone-like nucleoid-structuring protein, MvaT/MvaU family [Marinobacter sp. F3R08]|uniref:histone-like nucleoid-structuring protein, MvaT/MvaU family n=1 Tax=Marinobacter sp. F3R08 TaxID=2841559 RepID=UPI001C08D178|nr:histone-like nucleoid-structuring protein, MvaT/MvaU family [Marinobacter sp. F3R08]MBU2952296.1 DNA binding protein [Marinobacter sp. F3R08]
MSKINEYYQKKNLINQLTEELNALENDVELKSELELENSIRDLMSEYDKSPKDMFKVLCSIDPSINNADKSSGTNPKRPMKTYKNPHTGEIVKTRGGNHKTLNEWRAKYGKSAVQSWAS